METLSFSANSSAILCLEFSNGLLHWGHSLTFWLQSWQSKCPPGHWNIGGLLAVSKHTWHCKLVTKLPILLSNWNSKRNLCYIPIFLLSSFVMYLISPIISTYLSRCYGWSLRIITSNIHSFGWRRIWIQWIPLSWKTRSVGFQISSSGWLATIFVWRERKRLSWYKLTILPLFFIIIFPLVLNYGS